MKNNSKNKKDISGINKFFTTLAVLTMVFFFIPYAYANNLAIKNVSLIGQNAVKMQTGDTISTIQFDISQDNSWRFSPQLYDAVWVFVKYSVDGGNWKHAAISGVDLGSTTGTPLTYAFPSENLLRGGKVGAFLYRFGEGSGTLSTAKVKLTWNIQADGIVPTTTPPVPSKVMLKVFALEMVYIPEGAFYVGDTAGSRGFYKYNDSSPTAKEPYQITSEDPIKVCTSTFNNLTNPYTNIVITRANGDFCWDGVESSETHHDIPADYPKGFKAFYIMKYELTQGQYRDYLNTLTRKQQSGRMMIRANNVDNYPIKEKVGEAAISSLTNVYLMYWDKTTGVIGATTPKDRNGIRCDSTFDPELPLTFYCDLNSADGKPNQDDDGEFIPVNWVWGPDLPAYADWAGLRPMTELEYEKACRGTAQPVPGEYAWGGNASTITYATSITAGGSKSETSDGNFRNSNNSPPLRSGFAATNNTTSSRKDSGASFYGVMDLSGNLHEYVINVSRDGGRSFTRLTHGDGELGLDGNTNINWPENTWGNWAGLSSKVVNSNGDMSVSNRQGIAWATFERYASNGIRCARTAP